MAKDNNFQLIIDELQFIHDSFPDLRFGHVIQCAIDVKNRLNNINLNDRSSKEMLAAIKEYRAETIRKRGQK